jgi:hypothetical protein
VKIRLWGTEDECVLAAERLMRTPGLRVLSVDGPRADRGASVLVRVYVEVRLDPLPDPGYAGGSAGPGRHPVGLPPPGRQAGSGPRRRALPGRLPAGPGGGQ